MAAEVPDAVHDPPTEAGVPGRRWVYAVVAGMLYWFVRLIIGTVLVRPACEVGPIGGRALLLGVSAVGVALCAHAVVVSLRIRAAATESEGWWEVVGVSSALINAVALTAIVVESVSIFFIDPCA